MDAMLPLTGLETETPESREIAVEGVENPIAAVLINTFVPQLSHPLDFLVPPKFAEKAQVGSLVKVNVNGKEYLGVITERKNQTHWHKSLQTLRRVLTPWPLLDASTLELLESVSLHYGVGAAALLRYAIPTRRARIEKDFNTAALDLAETAPPDDSETCVWNQYEGGVEFLSAIKRGEHPRAVVSALPRVEGASNGFLPTRMQESELFSARFLPVAQLAKTAWQSGKQSLLIFPTAEEASEAYLFLRRYFSQAPQQVVLYTSAVSPDQAYKSFLQARFGQAAIVVATRGGVFIPLAKPGICYCWDNNALSLNSDMYPNFSARQVLLRRSVQNDMGLVFAHYSVSSADMQLVERGFAFKLAANREILRETTSRFQFLDWESQMQEGPTAKTLLPARALHVVRKALKKGPVLLLVPPDGQFSVVSCASCGQNATCTVCAGPLRFSSSRLVCSRCGFVTVNFACSKCGMSRVRGRLLQSRTVIEDIGKMFPEIPVLVSKPGLLQLSRIGSEPRIVVANPGGEPVPVGGYQAALILRAHMLASRTALWTSQEVMRRFLSAAALVAPGKTVLVTEPLGVLWEQGLIRWDPWGVAAVDLRERQEGHFAPAWRTALLQAPHLSEIIAYLRASLPEAMVLGPVESVSKPGLEAVFVSVPLRYGDELGKVLRILGTRFGIPDTATGLSIEVDPSDPGGQVM